MTNLSEAKGPVSLQELEPVAKFSVRCRNAAGLSAALGFDLPANVRQRAGVDGREALCLGPDEWVLTAPEADKAAIIEACRAAYETTPHALVDISDREISVMIEGADAKTLLTVGCPRDLDKLAVGGGVRTLFDSAQVVLWRDAEDRFRMDVWRSFYPHVAELLVIANAEIGATG
ncbi:MAG TPA: sarcosine oxidase subunit gamma family protein [Paracoccaceae bacterium]|nr:sarcosine oxidase subunit gamma family protein [Paracoccaceae bacterium]